MVKTAPKADKGLEIHTPALPARAGVSPAFVPQLHKPVLGVGTAGFCKNGMFFKRRKVLCPL